jgi:hypothetical protein
MNPTPSRLRNTQEGAAYLRVSPKKFRRLAVSGRLRAFRANDRGDWFTTVEWMNSYIASQAGFVSERADETVMTRLDGGVVCGGSAERTVERDSQSNTKQTP